MARLQGSVWVRRVVFSGVGLAVFLLGATYLNLRYPPDQPTFMLVGGEHIASGYPTAARVLARMIDARAHLPATVLRVELDGVQLPFESEGDDPVTIRFEVPGRLTGRTAELAVTARAGDREATMRARVGLITTDPEFERQPSPPPQLPITKRPFRLDLVPQGAGLISRLDNRVYLRVRDALGAPLAGATIRLTHSALPGGAVVRRSDASGLAMFTMSADRLSYRFDIEVTHGHEEARFERTILPAGRQLLLQLDKAAIAPGDKAEVRFITWKKHPTIFCDVRRGPVWLWSGAVADVDEETRLPVGPFPPGRYDIQCYFHPHTPGRSWATVPLMVGEADARTLLTEQIEREGLMHHAALPLSPQTDSALAEGYLQALLNAPPVGPTRLVNLRATDIEARDQRFETKKRTVLIALGGVFVLVLLIVADLILGNVLATRDRMRAYAAELAEDDSGPEPTEDLDELTLMANRSREGLVKTRGILLILIVGGTLIANAVALLALLALIR